MTSGRYVPGVSYVLVKTSCDFGMHPLWDGPPHGMPLWPESVCQTGPIAGTQSMATKPVIGDGEFQPASAEPNARKSKMLGLQQVHHRFAFLDVFSVSERGRASVMVH